MAWTGPGIASPTVITSDYLGIDAAAAAVRTITRQPAGVTGVLGGGASPTVGHNEVLGPLIYQWRLNGMALWPASSSPTLSLTNLSGGMAGSYDVIITSPEGTVTSSTAALTLSDAGAITSGGLWQEVFEDIPGSEVAAMTGEDRYPYVADSSAVLSTAESPSGFSDDYGQRITGWITPAVSGNYRLMAASDDHCELWLSTDKYPVHKVKIAERTSGYTSYRAWSSAVKSAYLPLVAGQKYYVEILHKEGGGGDHCSLNWQKQGDATPANGSAPLAGSFLSYRRGGVHDDYVFPLIQTQPAAQSANAGGSATFTVGALGPSLTYQWRRNGVALPGATGATLVLDNLGPVDAGSYDVVIGNTAATETSAAATLTVSATAVTAWLGHYGLAGAGLAADSDGDGWTNEQEYYAGTAPDSAGSQLSPLGVTRAGSATARLRWTSPHDGLAPASAYTLYAQDASFSNSPSAWTLRVRGIARQGNETEYDDNLATLDGLRVYAIRPTGVTGGPAPALLAVHRAVLPAGRQTWVSFPVTAPSMALQDLLPGDSLPAGATESTATVIDLWNAATQTFAPRYWLSSNPSYPGWRTSGTFLDAGATVLDPALGVAITVRSGQADQAVVIAGTVPQGASATRNLAAGYNLLSLAFPTSTALSSANLTGSGFTGATRFTTSDLLLVPDAAGAFTSQYWYNTASSSWVNMSGGGNADNVLIPAGRPLLILRRTGAFSWSNPRPYTLPLRGP
ncbi:MAG: PA14 domain-containing protein [Kiritimatiellia bacterium]